MPDAEKLRRPPPSPLLPFKGGGGFFPVLGAKTPDSPTVRLPRGPGCGTMQPEVNAMYELDKEKFGAFVAQLRKEKGYTQKELAERLYISNKAVSKWETGVSLR